MKRRPTHTRRLLAVMLAASLLSGALSGCLFKPPAIETQEGETVDYGDVAEAVTTAVPRIVGVGDFGRSLNGFGYRISLTLDVDSAEPLTADELDGVVEAIWRAVPWEPNTIMIIAGADTAEGREIVDLRAAAEELEGLGVTGAGASGASLTGMSERYGEWKAPE
jgi:hypothetical protein